MEKTKFKHFISYRRDGGDSYARTIYQQLLLDGHERDSIFFDVRSIDGFFDEEIRSAIEDCEDFIIVLTENSLERCSEQSDWVRQEITLALEKSKNIIPVAIEGKFKAFPNSFPAELERFTKINLSWLRMDDSFEDSMRKIEDKFGRQLKSIRKTDRDDSIAAEKRVEIVAQHSTELADEYYYGKEGGREFEKDIAKAKAFYYAGALAGSPYAQYSYGFILIHDLETSEETYSEAVRWLEEAANQGEVNAMSELGVLYYYGRGVQKDYNKCNSWYQKGADEGDSKCLLYLGMNYLYGHGKSIDPLKALELFLLAKENAQDDSILEDISKNIERAKKRGAN